MTLLEALLATVILSVVAIACLEGTRGAASLMSRADATTQAVTAADAALALAVSRAPAQSGARVTRQPYLRDGIDTGLERVDVEVSVPGAAPVRISRLVPRVRGVPR